MTPHAGALADTRMPDFLPFLFPAALIAVALYFRSRQGHAPTGTERRAALAWLLLRRLVCFSACLLCVVAVALCGYAALQSMSATAAIGAVLALSMSFVFAHWGMYGTGRPHSSMADDKPVHEARRKRYGWRW